MCTSKSALSHIIEFLTQVSIYMAFLFVSVPQMCFEQRCHDIKEVGDPACLLGSNGQQCSGNGVCYHSAHWHYSEMVSQNGVLVITYSNAATQACVHAMSDSLEMTAEQKETQVSILPLFLLTV